MPKRPELTQERLRELLDYNAETGEFRWRVTRNSLCPAGRAAGTLSGASRVIQIDRRQFEVGRLAWLHVYGVLPRKIRYRDRNRLNARLCNLAVWDQSVYVKRISNVSHAQLLELLHYSPRTGVFKWRKPRAGIRVGERAGSITYGSYSKIYRRISVAGRQYMEHRLAWFYTHRRWPSQLIDHKNGDGLDNRINNLRDVSPVENSANARLPVKTKGWDRHGGKYRARIRKDNREIYLGQFSSPRLAHAAYLSAAKKLYGARE